MDLPEWESGDMYIFSGVHMKQLSKTSIRLAFGSRKPLVIQDLLAQEIEWLVHNLLTSGMPQPHRSGSESEHLEHRVIKMTAKSRTYLEKTLIDHGFALKQEPPELQKYSASIFAEHSALHARGHVAERCLERRKSAVVALHGINKSTLAALRILCAAGITKFVVDNNDPFDSQDLLSDPLYPAVGPDRAHSIEHMLRNIDENAMVLSANNYVNFAIVSSNGYPDFLLSAQLSSHALPHLAVSTGPTQTIIGPLLQPNSTKNLCCFSSEFASDDFPWRISDLRPTPTTMSSSMFSSCDASAIGALIAHEVLAYYDQSNENTASTLTVFSHGSPIPRTVLPNSGSRCGCDSLVDH